MRRCFAMAMVCSALLATAVIADPGSVAEQSRDAKLLDILLERGIITAEEHAELSTINLDDATARRSELETKVEEVVARGYLTDEHEDTEVSHDRGFQFHTGDGLFSLKLNGYLQSRYTYTDFDSDRAASDTGAFSTPRVRFRLSGHAFDENLHYYVMADFSDSQDGGFTTLKDAWIEWRNPEYHYAIRAGQFKVPFGRQQLNSASELQFVDRSATSTFFGFGRDVGAMIHGRLADGFLGYAAGLFNGEGEDMGFNDNNEQLFALRVEITPLGDYRMYEGDYKHTEEADLSIGANYVYNPLGRATGLLFFGAPVEADTNQFGIDAQLRIMGLSVQGELFAREIEDDSSGSGLEEIDDTGFYLQAGYFVIPEHFEVAGRYGFLNREDDNVGIDDDLEELTLGLNYYFVQHNHKLQLDFTRLTFDPDSGSDLDDNIVRLQWQLKF